MSLKNLEIDQVINPLFIKKNVYEFGEEFILNQEGNPILKFKRNAYLPIDFLELRSKNQDKLYYLLEKRFSIKNVYYLLNSRGQKIGNFRTSLLTSQTEHAFYNLQDEEILEASTFSNKNQFSIKISNGNELVAEIKAPHKHSKEKPYLREYLCVNFSQDYGIDKLIIICFILYIRQIINNVNGISDITGFARRLARLRPFGPSKMDH